jgi:hypothetical protein
MRLPRTARLLSVSAEKDRASYEAQYADGLRSLLVIGVRSKALYEEAFPKRWKIVYHYHSKEAERALTPTSFTVYGYSAGTGAYDRVLTQYVLARAGREVAVYHTAAGQSKEVDAGYFVIDRPG